MFALKTGLPPELVVKLYPLLLESVKVVIASLSFRLRASALCQIANPVTSGGVIPPTDGLAEGDALAEALKLGLALALADLLADRLGLADADAEGLELGDTLAEADKDCEALGLAEALALKLGLADLLADLDADGEAEALAPWITGIDCPVLIFNQYLPCKIQSFMRLSVCSTVAFTN